MIATSLGQTKYTGEEHGTWLLVSGFVWSSDAAFIAFFLLVFQQPINGPESVVNAFERSDWLRAICGFQEGFCMLLCEKKYDE